MRYLIISLLTAGIMLICNPKPHLTPVAFLGNIGISPDAQSLSLLGILSSITFLIACLKPQAKHNRGFLLTKSRWLTGLILLPAIVNIAVVSVYCSLTYDYSSDNILKDLNKNRFRVISTVKFVETAELLNDDTLSTDSPVLPESKQDTPSLPFMQELIADTNYQTTAPAIIMNDIAPEKPQKYVQRRMAPPPDKPRKAQDSDKISQADYAELKRYITNLEERKYVQTRSIKQRQRLLPLLKEIANGSSINTRKKELGNWTALHYACAIGDVNITRWLLQHGAKQQLRNAEGDTPAQCIGPNHSKEIRNLLNKYNKK